MRQKRRSERQRLGGRQRAQPRGPCPVAAPSLDGLSCDRRRVPQLPAATAVAGLAVHDARQLGALRSNGRHADHPDRNNLPVSPGSPRERLLSPDAYRPTRPPHPGGDGPAPWGHPRTRGGGRERGGVPSSHSFELVVHRVWALFRQLSHPGSRAG
jgi:hypothetical protein